MHQVIGEGRALSDTPISPDGARSMLEDAVRARVFDERAVALQRRGWMSGYPPVRGHEASQVGTARAMDADDWLVPYYRSNALQIARGVPMADLLRFRRGYPEFASGHEVPVFPQAIPIATQLPHAVGLAMAADHRDDDVAVLAALGDGATSEGDFHEACNFAGVFDAPVVFLCENNGWAISTPRERQTAARSIAGRAGAYGLVGAQVDGTDPIAVLETVTDALASARAGEPVLVESLTYRQGAHTTSDDPSRYREDDPDLPEWRTADPVERFADYLRAEGAIEAGTVEAAREAAREEVAAAVESAETAAPAPDDVFDHAFADLPAGPARQREALRGHVARHGDPTDGA